MEKVLLVDTDKCKGCRICELVCSVVKFGMFIPSKSYIRVLKNKDMDVNIVVLGTKCDFCGECVEFCAPQALKFVDLKEANIGWKGVKIGTIPAPLMHSI